MKYAQKYLLLILTCLILSSCLHGRGNPERFYFGSYSEAEKLFNKGDYEKAIVKYQEYINTNPDGNLAVISEYYIGKSHLALGQTDEAKSIFEQISKEHPDLVWAKFSDTQLKEIQSK